MIECRNLTYRYETMLMDFTLQAPGNSITAVIGPSGGGKSTLLNLIAGFEKPLSGSLSIDSRDMLQLGPSARPVNMIFQDNNSFAHLDVWTNVALGVSPTLNLTPDQDADVEQALQRTGIAHFAKRRPGEMSGGERQRIAIARALVRNRPVLLLDEPFAALGPALRHEMLDLLRAVQVERSLTVMMVTHHPDDAKRISASTIFLSGGKILAHRPTAELFAANDVRGLREYLGT
jgi:thiamine transport system ATP-binding protein